MKPAIEVAIQAPMTTMVHNRHLLQDLARRGEGPPGLSRSSPVVTFSSRIAVKAEGNGVGFPSIRLRDYMLQDKRRDLSITD